MTIYNITVKDFVQHQDDGGKYFLFITQACKMPSGIPLDANLRQPKKDSKIYHDIVHTITQEPTTFLGSNLGIRVTAQECKIIQKGDRTVLSLNIAPGQGILNGAHTYQALFSASRDGADMTKTYVTVMVHVGLENKNIPKVCLKLNSASKVDRRSLLQKQGLFDELRELLEEKGFDFISYYQNQSHSLSNPNVNISNDPRCSVIHVATLLDCIDSERWDISKQPVRYISSGASVHKAVVSKAVANFDKCWEDAFSIEKRVYQLAYETLTTQPKLRIAGVKLLPKNCDEKTIKKCVHLCDGSILEMTAPRGFSLPIVTAFRVFYSEQSNGWDFPFKYFSEGLINVLWLEYQNILVRAETNNQSFRSVAEDSNTWVKLVHAALSYKSKFLRERTVNNLTKAS